MTEASVPHDPKMTPDRATAELNRLTEEYRKSQTPPGESIEAHIARLSQDKGFAEALFSGNAQARAKFEEAFKSLREGGPSLPVGDMPPMGYRSVTQENEAASAALLRTKGIREE